MADVEQDLEKIAEKEKLEELENEVKELRNRSRRNNRVYFHMFRKKQKDKNVQISSKTL